MKKLTFLFLAFVLVLGASVAHADTLIFTGDYLRVGVSESGGVVDDNFVVGIDYDKDGAGTFSTGGDFIKPGTPREFYSLGVGGNWDAAGYDFGNNFSAVTTDTSTAGLFSATTVASFGGLIWTQVMSFAQNSGIIGFVVTVENPTDEALRDIVYARGLDPDQDVYFPGGGYATTNTIVNGNLVTASAPISDWTIGIFSDDDVTHVASISSEWESDPYVLLGGMNDGYGDYTINMAWDIGTLTAGSSLSFAFEYRIGESAGEVINPGAGVPEPGTFLLMGLGLAGLIGLRRKMA